ncbi:MAG: biopolymer transporter ExbD [Candidatus Margulisiibacteriota bacterium]
MSEINIVPFTDIVLVLLIFFIVITPFLIQSALKVNLPYAKPVSELTKEIKIKITITKNQEIYLNEERQKDFITLETNLKKLHGKKELAQIQADKDINYGFVVKVIGIFQKLGLTNFELSTQNISD